MSYNQFNPGFSNLNSDPLLNKSDNRAGSLLEGQSTRVNSPISGDFPQVIVAKLVATEATEATLAAPPVYATPVEPPLAAAEKKVDKKTDKELWNFPELTGLRALAVFIVYAVHAVSFPHKLNGTVSFGGFQFNFLFFADIGILDVSLYFVISSFVLFLAVCKTPQSLQNWSWRVFYLKRVRRIVPAYYAAIIYSTLFPALAALVLAAAFPSRSTWFLPVQFHLPWLPEPSLWQYGTHLLFIHSFFKDTFFSINDSFWFLGPEVQFYVVFPLFVWGFRRWGLIFLGVPLLISLAYRLIADVVFNASDIDTQNVLTIIGPGRWMQFFAGMLVAWLVVSYKRRGTELSALKGNGLVLLSLVFIWLSLLSKDLKPTSLLFDILQGAGYALLVFALVISRTPVRRIFSSRIVVWVGKISYSLFLTHIPLTYYLSLVFAMIPGISDKKMYLLLIVVGFPINCGFAYLFYRCFETSFISKKIYNVYHGLKRSKFTKHQSSH